MGTEALFYREAVGLPVPEVVHAEPGFLLMTEIPGRPWYPDKPPADTRAGLRGELGGIVANLHKITGTGFGYPQMGLHDTGRPAFRQMLTSVLADADGYGMSLPVPAAKLVAATDSAAFDEVDRP